MIGGAYRYYTLIVCNFELANIAIKTHLYKVHIKLNIKMQLRICTTRANSARVLMTKTSLPSFFITVPACKVSSQLKKHRKPPRKPNLISSITAVSAIAFTPEIRHPFPDTLSSACHYVFTVHSANQILTVYLTQVPPR